MVSPDVMANVREEIANRAREYQVTLEVAEKLQEAASSDPGKAKAAAAAVERCRLARERATFESVVADLGFM